MMTDDGGCACLSVEQYLPHRRPMLLLDGIEAIGAAQATCWSCLERDHAAGAFLADDGSLPGIFAMELIAQTVGVWAGRQRQLRGEARLDMGLLLGVRDLTMPAAGFAAHSRLSISVQMLVQDGKTGSFAGHISCRGQLLASGHIHTFQTDSAAELDRVFTI